jgi:hypothetical protein
MGDGGIGDMIALIPMIISFIITLPQRFMNIFAAIMNIQLGLILEMKNVGIVTGIVLTDAYVFLLYTWELIRTYMICGPKILANLTNCLIYYIIDFAAIVLYLPVRIFLAILKALGINLYPVEKKIFEGLEKVDRIVFTQTGFHIIHWPKSIRDQCYNCKRLKLTVYSDRIVDMIGDFTTVIPAILATGLKYLGRAGTNIENVFASNPPMPDLNFF